MSFAFIICSLSCYNNSDDDKNSKRLTPVVNHGPISTSEAEKPAETTTEQYYSYHNRQYIVYHRQNILVHNYMLLQ